ncbi:MAG TPA: hemerythrin domain-containing protein [Candidatus Babeliaceae bacterium]|nr:hemerythrin domain-containing protein [Candidatus Babeliaceae bacterium]
MKKGINVLRIKSYINFFWKRHLYEHFQEEEALLFNRITDQLTSQAKQEHGMLTERINRMNYYEVENGQDFLFFAELLIKHIRFEERVLFPHLEKELPISVLANVGAYLKEKHQTPFKEDYPDKFWEEQTNGN